MYNGFFLIHSFQNMADQTGNTQNAKEPMSNSGTTTSCLAAFMRLPIPVFLADKSDVSAVLVSSAFVAESLFGCGVAGRVGVADGTSISMNTEGCRCIRAFTSDR
jgi:hypothetical protein